MTPKVENCPDCNKALDQAEYDGQYCRACGTEPFGFQSPAPKDLAGMITFVELLRAEISLTTVGFTDNAESHRFWREKRQREIDAARKVLEAHGARCRDEWNGAAIKLMGIRSTCTSGFDGALSNWLTAARKRSSKNIAA